MAESIDSKELNSESLFEIGKLYADRGDFLLSLEKLKIAADKFVQEKKFPEFLKCTNLILRLFVETDQLEQVQLRKEQLQDLVIKENLELNSRLYYTLALCSFYKGQVDASTEYFQKALTLALQSDNKEDLSYAVFGMAGSYFSQKKFPEALKEIYNLQIFLSVLDIPEIKASTGILNGLILIEMKKYDQAFDILWQTYDVVRNQKTMMMHIYLLVNLGRAYWKSGQKDLARVHFRLAHRAIDPANMKRLSRQLDAEMAEIGEDLSESYDLVFEVDSHTVVEKKLGRIDFKNQFILLDLLRLFVQNQGQVYTKESLVEQVWKQQYDPAVHDNKIYVTIKRLRKLIEPDYEKPKYIFRAKNGYYMNKEAKVLIEDRGGLQ